MNYSNEYKLALGIEIVSAMKANVYNLSMEEGRQKALSDTSIETLIFDDIEAEFHALDGLEKDRIIEFTKKRKMALEEQAIFVANAVIKFIESQNVS